MVKVLVLEYEIKDKEGRIIGSSKFEGPLRVKLGVGEIWKELEENLKNLSAGEEAEFQIHVPYEESKVKKIKRNLLPFEELKEGEQIFIETLAGRYPALVRKIEGEWVELDLNPPFAGEKLFYKVKVLYVEELN